MKKYDIFPFYSYIFVLTLIFYTYRIVIMTLPNRHWKFLNNTFIWRLGYDHTWCRRGRKAPDVKLYHKAIEISATSLLANHYLLVVGQKESIRIDPHRPFDVLLSTTYCQDNISALKLNKSHL